MSKTTSVKYTPVSDEELARIEQETKERDKVEPRVQEVHYSPKLGDVSFIMRGLATVTVRARDLPGLEDATDEQLKDVIVVSQGSSVHWPSLDVQMSTIALLQIIFGIHIVSEVTRRAGSARSAAKTAAARENGRKGGRPRKSLVTA